MNEANAPDSELKAFGVLSEPQGFGQGLVTAGPEGGRAEARAPKYVPNPRPPQGIVDPANRQLPYTPEARAKRLDYAKNMCCPAKSLPYLELSVRCAPPSRGRAAACRFSRSPEKSRCCSSRTTRPASSTPTAVPTRAPTWSSSAGIRQGRWEGNDLVVDTTNLDGRAYYGVGNTFAPYSQAAAHHGTLHRRVGQADHVRAHLRRPEDVHPSGQVGGFLYPNDEDEELTPEFTCHEGSYALPDIFGF